MISPFNLRGSMNNLISLISIFVLSAISYPHHFFKSHTRGHTRTTPDKTLSLLSKEAPTLDKRVLQYALSAYHEAEGHGFVKKPVLTVIDYSLPSSKQRMWIFDLNSHHLLFNTYVAHGRNSGDTVPRHFSNLDSSKQTSLGTYITKDTYYGGKGYSLNLQGIEKGFNDHAYDRRIVVHGAWYMEPGFIKQSGRAGRSWGCPAIAATLARPLINSIKGGSVVFAYYPDHNYFSHSAYV